jgi:hypothetical protein
MNRRENRYRMELGKPVPRNFIITPPPPHALIIVSQPNLLSVKRFLPHSLLKKSCHKECKNQPSSHNENVFCGS